MLYCVKERKHTEDIDPVDFVAKNGRNMRRAKCASCGITKTQFIKKGGFLGQLALAALPQIALPALQIAENAAAERLKKVEKTRMNEAIEKAFKKYKKKRAV